MSDAIKVQYYEVKKSLNDLSEIFTSARLRRLLSRLGMGAKINILTRTAAGIDAGDAFFEPYSYKYKLFRKRKGRPTDKVDLFFKGTMLGSMAVRTESNKSIIYFANKWEGTKAGSHHHGTKKGGKKIIPKREFFALSASDIIDIEKMVDDHIRVAMESR